MDWSDGIAVRIYDEQILIDPTGRHHNLFQLNESAMRFVRGTESAVMCRANEYWDDRTNDELVTILKIELPKAMQLSGALGREVWF